MKEKKKKKKTVREKSGKLKTFQVREKSGNFNFSQGNLGKVREKSGTFRIFQTCSLFKASEKYNFYKLQGVYGQKSKKISKDQEPIQSDPTSCTQNQKGNN